MNRKSNVRIKILYVGSIPPEVGGKKSGGVATYSWELATTACKNGYDVYILTNTHNPLEKDEVKIIGWPLGNKLKKIFYGIIFYITNKEKIKELSFLRMKEKFNVIYKYYILKRIIKSIKPDLIHVLHILNDVIFSLSLLKSKPPIVCTEYGVALLYEQDISKLYGFKNKDFFYDRVRKALDKIDCVISCSNFSKLELSRVFNTVPNNKIKAVLIPINTNRIRLISKNKAKNTLGIGDKKIVTFCGVNLPVRRKGLDILLKAFAINSYLLERCKLIVITNEYIKKFAQNFIDKNKIDGIALSFQPLEKLVEYYNATDVFTMPSKQEGMGLVYYEALLAGVPVIGFFRSVLEIEQTLGIYIGDKFNSEKENETDLAKKIIKVLDMKVDRNILRNKVIENLSWDVKFKEYDLIYRELLE
jgi:glycosyltransferase involved in cell wall biosynthesis